MICRLYDSNVPVSSVTLKGAGDVSTITAFDHLQMEAEVLPSNASDKSITWEVTNETGIATITKSGVVVGHQAGTVKVKAVTNDGSAVFGEKVITIDANTEEGLYYRTEIEFGKLEGAVVGQTDCVNKSGLGVVTYFQSNASKSTHEYVYVPADGNYDLNITYFSALENPVKINLYINDIALENPTTLDFENVGLCADGPSAKKSVVVALKQGFNTIIFKNSGKEGPEPQIDLFDVTAPKGLVESITVSSANDVQMIKEGEELQLSTEVLPLDADDKSVTWSVVNGTGKATIDASGNLTAVQFGTVTVKAKANDGSGVEGTFDLTIEKAIQLVTEIQIASATNSNVIKVGNDLQLNAIVLPAEATNSAITWSVVNQTGTATIDQQGLLSATALGTVVVKATANDASGITAEFEVSIVSSSTAVESIVVESSGEEIGIQKAMEFTASVLPLEATNKSVEWTVINGTGSAVISESGNLVGLTEGSVTIQAMAKDGSGVTGSKDITVLADDPADTGIILVGEFETGALSGPTAEVRDACESASGGKFVRLFDDSANSVTLSIDVEKAGKYRLRTYFYNALESTAKLTVNGSASEVSFPKGRWCYEGASEMADFAVELTAGTNQVSFSPVEGLSAPLLDNFELVEVKLDEVALVTKKLRLRSGEVSEIIVSVDHPVLEEESVELEVTGLAQSDYTLSSTSIIIPKGQKTGKVEFTALANAGSGQIKIKNPSSGVYLNGEDSGEISVLTEGQTIYISSSEGDDKNDGLSEVTPLQTINALNGIRLIPGDKVLFKNGDRFVGQLKCRYSGEEGNAILYTTYGNGEKALLTASTGNDGVPDPLSTIDIVDQSYLEFENLRIQNERFDAFAGAPDDMAFGILYTSNKTIEGDFEEAELSKHIHMRNLYVDNVYSLGIDGVDFNAVRTSGIYFEEALVSDVIIENSYFTNIQRVGVWMRKWLTDVIVRNNEFTDIGGSGAIFSNSRRVMYEHNLMLFNGSDSDDRMAKRGSGMWVFSCKDVVAQYNVSKHARGNGDSSGMHVDYGNDNILFQYNYSEDAAGGFCEILGDNRNVIWRYNISVNDADTDRGGKNKLFFINKYSQKDLKSEGVYIYNNTIHSGTDQKNEVSDSRVQIEVVDIHFYNNIINLEADAKMGIVEYEENIDQSDFKKNIFYGGTIHPDFLALDQTIIESNPLFLNAGTQNGSGYVLTANSPALGTATSFEEPEFPLAGQGIFADVTSKATNDYYGNPVDLTGTSNIGAYNGAGSTKTLFPQVFEAEEATLNNSTVIECTSSSNSKAVNASDLTFTFTPEEEGEYLVKVYYLSSTMQALTHSINGGEAEEILMTRGSGMCDEGVPAQYHFTQSFKNGENTITLSGMLIDKIEILVESLNENPPVFTSPNTATVMEGVLEVLQLVTTDADGEGSVSYSISGGEDAAFFAISGDRLVFKAPVDFENPSDANGDNVYIVEVTANDGVHMTTQIIEVIVIDNPNEHPPVFTTESEIDVIEGETFVVILETTDLDLISEVTYSITGGSDMDHFKLEGDQLSFINPPSLSNPTDSNQNNSYIVEVTADDGEHTVSMFIYVYVKQNDITSIDDVENQSVSVYPNPVVRGDKLNLVIQSGQISEGYKVSVFNAQGVMMHVENVTDATNKQIETVSIPTGMYFMTIEYKDTLVTKRFVVQ
ncbi:Ig-like domain-containing protein [Flammeovirga aprica]|uniref:T9SS type A sorting domain-containing protein n=1 Tax=Flammeovirga aprica JL-4 TaxID=694437 RepID=A0A7X9RUQ6_9BACT|nr:Ig-like domain-containing protein [Flammeovirga aprica]NME68994.1 T9SS type A sorting domain-containing protein [Flammeovirga aprica JL-4]